MIEVVWSNGFKRSFKRITKRNPQLQAQIIKSLRLLAENPFSPSLNSHKLGGNLSGFGRVWLIMIVGSFLIFLRMRSY